MKYYRMKFGTLERELPICRVTETLYIAGFVLLGDPALSKECARELLEKAPEYDYILTAEAKGITLAHEMALQHGDERFTTAKEQSLYLDGADAALLKGKRVLIVDDVISTGESLGALEALVTKAGGNIVGKMAVLGEGDAASRSDITVLQALPLFNADGTIKK